jgi:alpha-tubulin suppressor-like RCC1 family protein
MRTRLRHQPVTTWLAIAGGIVAAIVVVVLVAALSHHGSGTATTTPSNVTLRLDPGAIRVRGRAAGGGGQSASSISAADYSTCAVVKKQAVQCWGDDSYGQLGDGSKLASLRPTLVRLGRPARAVSAGGSHACAVLDSGTVSCWGANAHGELGNGTQHDSPTPVPVPGIRDAVAVAAGVAHTCVLRRTGAVDCFGAGGNGQLGNDGLVDRDTPVAVRGLGGPVRALTAGLAHTCALLVNGTVECWGSNANGELGNGTLVDTPHPVEVSTLPSPAAAVDAGDAHTCALLRNGKIFCWGWNIEGQLGNGGGTDSDVPVAVTGLPGPAAAVASPGSHTCALLRSEAVACWGANLYGQLGNGTTSDSATPVTVTGLGGGVVAITAGLYHTCALLSGGAATCWGWNQQGQLGNGTTTSVASPVGVAGLGLAPDGTGTVFANPRSVPGSERHTTLAFTYTVAPGGIHGGATV